MSSYVDEFIESGKDVFDGTGAISAPANKRELIPVRSGDRQIGAYAVGTDRTRFIPAVDVTVLVLGSMALATVTAVAIAISVVRRKPPTVGTVTMGPGGWLSLKQAATPPLHAATGQRPWWAHPLRAHRLVV